MDPWRKGDIDAIGRLNELADEVEFDPDYALNQGPRAVVILAHAIRHIAYPDRDVYPKVRHGSKKHPVTR